MKFSSLLSAALFVALVLPGLCLAQVPDLLQRNCVTVAAGYSSGSGTIVVREVDGKDRAFVWTAHHVIDGLRKVKTVLVDGSDKKVIVYDDASIVTEIQVDGRTVGDTRLNCKVLICSPRYDLAVLEVRAPASVLGNADGIAFDLSGDLVPVGTELYHCGSPSGQELGHNSLTDGIVSANGRMFDYTGPDLPYTQTSCSALPGSSGGIVALKESGLYAGMLTLGIRNTDTFNYIVPVRRIVEWANEEGIGYLVDPSVEALTEDDLLDLPVEDSGRRATERQDAAAPEGMYFPIIDNTPAPMPAKKSVLSSLD
jgi:S1-C subfamily serine protease